MNTCSGLKTLIYGTAAGIDPHRINRSKLPPWYIANPCYRSPPPCQFPPFPSRSAPRAVGQSSRTALPASDPAPPSPCLHPSAPLLYSHISHTLMNTTTFLQHQRGQKEGRHNRMTRERQGLWKCNTTFTRIHKMLQRVLSSSAEKCFQEFFLIINVTKALL